LGVPRRDGSKLPLGNKGRGGAAGFTPRAAAAAPGFQGSAGRFAPFTGSGVGSTARGEQPAQRQMQIPSGFSYMPESVDAPMIVAPATRAVPLANLVRQTGKNEAKGGPKRRPSPMVIKSIMIAAKKKRR